MKLSSLILLTVMSASAMAQSNPVLEIETVKSECRKVVSSFDDPEEPSLDQFIQRTRESFLKLNYSITASQAHHCITQGMNVDDNRLATASEVLMIGYAAECLHRSLVPVPSAPR